MNRLLPYYIVISLLLLIFFDAAQQYYYLTTFQLTDGVTAISFTRLLKSHLIRWCILLFSGIPFFAFTFRRFSRDQHDPLFNIPTIALLFTCLLFSLILVSIFSLNEQQLEFSLSNFNEFFAFFFYQKGITFLMALLISTLLIANYCKERSIKGQLVEIKRLKTENNELLKNGDAEEVPHLNIRTGHKVKPVPINEIVWIQSDDYCVKVHTSQHTYTLRQSLKVLEEKLQRFRFIRVHRSALLNLNYLDQINYKSSTIKLKNQSEVHASKTGIRKLRSQLVNN